MDHSDAVILARVSSKAQEDEGYSLDSQLKLLQAYCDKHGLNVVKTFKIAETASKDQSRKVFHEMLRYISYNKIYHLAVEKTDRFTRNFRDAVAIDDWLKKDENRRLHAVKENMLLHKHAKSDVKFMWGIHVTVAKKYSDNLREESMKGWAEKLAQGWMPAPPPPGYKTAVQNGKRIHVPDPETKDLMRKAFKLYLEPGQTIKTVGKEMRLMGITNSNGRPYVTSRVHKLLTNPYYIGINHFDGKDYPGAQEPIISKKLFDDVQYKIHKGRPRAYGKHEVPLKGLIRCEDCKSVVTWQLQKGHYYGVCRRLTAACRQGRMLRQDAVEQALVKRMSGLVSTSPEVIDWVVEAVKSRQHDNTEYRQKKLDAVNAQIARINRMDEALYDDKLSGEIPNDKYQEKHLQFMGQIAELNRELESARQNQQASFDKRLVILELSQKAAQIFQHKPAEQKRLIISLLFDRLILKNGELIVSYTSFAQVLAKKVLESNKLMEGAI